MVEHDLAKVGVAGSSPVFRSGKIPTIVGFFFKLVISLFNYSGGGTGRHAGLKIPFAAMQVWVQLPSRVLNNGAALLPLFCYSFTGITSANP